MAGHGEKLTRKQEQAIAALLTANTQAKAARRAGISERTLRNWLALPRFQAAYRRARRGLVETAVGRLQAATNRAVNTLLAVAKNGSKDSDRVRAAVAILDHALRGLSDAGALHDNQIPGDSPPMDTGDVVQLLAAHLRQIGSAELTAGERSRLTATVADSLLRAIGADTIAKRLEALDAVLIGRKETQRKQ
jgi:hypothetical protein